MRWGQKAPKPSVASTSWRDAQDEVTGLATYATFVLECTDALAAYTAAGTPAQPAILLVDLDVVSQAVAAEDDTAADELLRLLATRVAREVGSLGVLARMSEHELGVLFTDLSDLAVALDLAYRVVSSVSSPVSLDGGRHVQVSASCGLATRAVLDDPATVTNLLRGAGLAVLEARRSGGSRIEVCTPEMITVADETLAIGHDLRKALQEQGLRVCYQPLVDLSKGSVLGFEALVRWSHPVHGHVSPSRFVPVAEEFGLISELGRMVLATASAQIQQWSSKFDIPLNAHVNFSGLDLGDDGFVAMVEECLESSGLPPSQLVVEVTEATVEPDLETARAQFDALHALGVRVALDDFGTGRTELAYLQSLTVDIIKVDRSYLERIDELSVEGHQADDMLRGVVGLGEALDIDIYGEGIEDEAHRLRLLRAGCEFGQGYLFGRPLPAEDTAAYLRRQTGPPLGLSARLQAAEAAAST